MGADFLTTTLIIVEEAQPSHQKATMWNTLKVGFLLTALTCLFVFLGNMLGGQVGMIIAFVLALVMNGGAFWFGDKMAIMATRAQPMDRSQAPEIYRMTEELAEKAGIPMPRLYYVPDPTPNAFAVGRNPKVGVVALNEGLLRMLTPEEVKGVIAHEIAHIKHRDTLTMAIVASLAGGIMMVANILQFTAFFMGGDEDSPNPIMLLGMALIAPIAATIIQLAVSRAREYEADKTAAQLVGTGEGLTSALLKLERGLSAMPSHVPSNRAHMYISSPISRGGLANLFRTHPATEDRVRKLSEVEAQLRRV